MASQFEMANVDSDHENVMEEEEQEQEEKHEEEEQEQEQEEKHEIMIEEDVIGSILDDPANEQLLRPQSQSIRGMETASAVYTMLYGSRCFAKHASWQGVKPYVDWTHNLMHGEYGGGFVLDSTVEMERKFLHAYAIDMRYGSTHYIIERKTPFFKFHADFDIKRHVPLDDSSILMYMKQFYECVRKFYPSTTALSRFDMVVCTSITTGKSGIHVIFPNLIVNQNQAIDIRNYFVSFMIATHGDMVGLSNSWEDIVDISVYEANGLRMVGSHKAINCDKCQGQKPKKRAHSSSPRRNMCMTCGGRGKLDSGKTYKPWFYIREGAPHTAWTSAVRSGVWCTISEGSLRRAVIELCSIRCPSVNETSSDFCIADEDMEKWTKTRGKTTANMRSSSPNDRIFKQIQTDQGTYRMTAEDAKGMDKWRNKQFIPQQHEIYQSTQSFISSKNFHKEWRNLIIHNMFTNASKTFYVINVRGEGQRWCLNNRKGSHKSNNIYFYIDRKTSKLTQRCYCSCQTTENRKRGKCEDFVSEPIPIVSTLERLLFPMIDSKIGHLHSERAIGIQDLDEYCLRLANIVAKIDDERVPYLESRNERLNQKTSDDTSAPNSTLDIKKRKRTRKPQGSSRIKNYQKGVSKK